MPRSTAGADALPGWTIGYNGGGQLGIGTRQEDEVFHGSVEVRGLTWAVGIAAGYEHTCALIPDGAVRCWGRNGSGELGDGTTRFRAEPVTVAGISGVTAITLGTSHTCAEVAGGGVRCWGANEVGQLGDGSDPARMVAVVSGAD